MLVEQDDETPEEQVNETQTYTSRDRYTGGFYRAVGHRGWYNHAGRHLPGWLRIAVITF